MNNSNTGYVDSICIAGKGTAGLISALMLRQAFPRTPITIIGSSEIGIVGVGEGSTEHWKMFENIAKIDTEEMIANSRATHKYGIRFEEWTNHTSMYFHSIVGQVDDHFGSFPMYNYLHSQGKLLTNSMTSPKIIDGLVNAESTHKQTNQFHFDTYKLNEYLTKLCIQRGVTVLDRKIKRVNMNTANGGIESLSFEDGHEDISADFWIDATGFKRLLMTEIGNTEWVSYSKYLPVDSAIAFPTPSDESGIILPFTRAKAMKYGWMWEIPTQDRRGNGYVYSSQYCDEESAINEASNKVGHEITTYKSFRFNSGRLRKFWHKNCVAIGLSGSFVEPLEATSISTGIIQTKMLISQLSTFTSGSYPLISQYNKTMDTVMDNLLSMIALHYISDRSDTEMWANQKNAPLPDTLRELIDIWAYRTPEIFDINTMNGLCLFGVPHFWHVAQGQGLVSRDSASRAMHMYGVFDSMTESYRLIKKSISQQKVIPHAKALQDTSAKFSS